MSIDDAALIQIVGRDLDRHAVSDEDANVIALHAPRAIAQQLSPILERDFVERIVRSGDDFALVGQNILLFRHGSHTFRLVVNLYDSA